LVASRKLPQLVTAKINPATTMHTLWHEANDVVAW
jgi:hypothetical protein